MSNPFASALDLYRPGSEIDQRIQKMENVIKELGIKWGQWTGEEYIVICELAGVERKG